MHHQEERRMLKNLFLEMEKLRIPKNIESQELGEWIENLMELDPYYAGLALTVAEGGKVSLQELYDINTLNKSLDSIQLNLDQDKKAQEACRVYLKTIEKIDMLLRKCAT